MASGPAHPPLVVADSYGPQGRSAWLDMDWREHQRWVEVGGSPVNVIELGSGDPVVFIHGLSGSWQNWLENLPHFARTHRVIALDLPGFGHSPMPADKISISGYGRCVAALLEKLDVERASVVGNSMGGFIGAEIAIQFPAMVERLVLVSAAGLTTENLRSEPGMLVLRRMDDLLLSWGGWLASRSDVLSARPRTRRALMRIVVAHAEKLPRPLIAEQIRGSGKPGFVDAVDALTSYPIRERLGDIGCPVLVVWGEDDRLVPVRDAYKFGELISDSRVVVYADTGHMAQLERPDAFNALVDDFLATAPSAASVAGEVASGDPA